ncbi:Lar family restriction alleviation protein [Methanomassiliicoccales archaeon LGM-RCC1]|nr:Lar family restriction alleviation protein [Methanomassiliicoccales archaeon LGM-RCC1]
MTELKPCPFCGSNNVQNREDDGRYILCNTCHIEVRDHQGTDRQFEMWNRRVNE